MSSMSESTAPDRLLRMRARLSSILGVVALVALTATPAHASIESVAGCGAKGFHAHCTARGGAPESPRAIYVQVNTDPNQAVSGDWSVDCRQGSHARGTHGTFSGGAPLKRKLKLPYTSPDECTVVVDAELATKGKLSVYVYAVH